MINTKSLPFTTLLALISFASVNAVLFTPAMPAIAHYFGISAGETQTTISWFLIGYAMGQLLYGPIANRFGRKPALYSGITLQIISSLLCILSGYLHFFPLLVIGRFLLALGSGVGLKMTFTLVNECYETKIASQKISYLMLAFAITPGLGIAIGGLLNTHFGWISCFYACLIYGFILLLLVMRLPETQSAPDLEALKINHLIENYGAAFKNKLLLLGSLLMGCATTFVYAFATLAPFLAINLMGMNSSEYGLANLLPAMGLIAGSLTSAQAIKFYSQKNIIRGGIIITALATIYMSIALWYKLMPLLSLFLPMIFIYFGLSFVIANASAFAMNQITDKAHGSAVMNFINMGLTTLVILSLESFHVCEFLLPTLYIILSLTMITIFQLICDKMSR